MSSPTWRSKVYDPVGDDLLVYLRLHCSTSANPRMPAFVALVLRTYSSSIYELDWTLDRLCQGKKSLLEFLPAFCELSLVSFRLRRVHKDFGDCLPDILSGLGGTLRRLEFDHVLSDMEIKSLRPSFERFRNIEVLIIHITATFWNVGMLLDLVGTMPKLCTLFITRDGHQSSSTRENIEGLSAKIDQLLSKQDLDVLSMSHVLLPAGSTEFFHRVVDSKRHVAYFSVVNLDQSAFEGKVSYSEHNIQRCKLGFARQSLFSRKAIPWPDRLEEFVVRLEALHLDNFVFQSDSLSAFETALRKSTNLSHLVLEGCSLPMNGPTALIETLSQVYIPHLELIDFLAPKQFYIALATLAITTNQFSEVLIANEFSQSERFSEVFAKTEAGKSVTLQRIDVIPGTSVFDCWLAHNAHTNRVWNRCLLIFKFLRWNKSIPTDMNVVPCVLSFLPDLNGMCKDCSGAIPFMEESLFSKAQHHDEEKTCAIS
eukprot:TRINITY_DN9643_c0_g1_i3.p1 TRINITY_DN9643_c0_g1~~TRINITY_DN9643_c0_g1_i3.p1  ORF type:complete len:484 (+),score=87.95 TRINITY_DN9643_c0_g1_i3:604-2055(+)